jgi:hypothetical protein
MDVPKTEDGGRDRNEVKTVGDLALFFNAQPKDTTWSLPAGACGVNSKQVQLVGGI